MTALLDVNTLLALAWTNHPHHVSARKWFDANCLNGWATCQLTQSALVRLSMNPKIVGVEITCETALELLSSLVSHKHHTYAMSDSMLSFASYPQLWRRVVGYR